MRIIPAIDSINGQCVRLTQGDYDNKTVYSRNPLEVALAFEKAGFDYLHLVDLDGAKAGKVCNLNVLREITDNTSLKVDFGGGIKSEADLSAVLDAGATQVTIGSLALKNAPLFQEWIKRFGAEKFILAADVKDRKIAVSAWQENSSMDLFDFIRTYYELGIRTVLCTDISKDGMLSGPAFDLYEETLQVFPDLDLIASGGVSSLEDVQELQRRKIPAVVIGKAIYEKRIELEDLILLRPLEEKKHSF